MTEIVSLHIEEIIALCKKWEITELSLFGSALRKDFNSSSDIDLLIRFNSGATWDLWDIIHLKIEFEKLFGRNVDIAEDGAIKNAIRNHEIMSTKEIIYAA